MSFWESRANYRQTSRLNEMHFQAWQRCQHWQSIASMDVIFALINAVREARSIQLSRSARMLLYSTVDPSDRNVGRLSGEICEDQ